MNKVIFAGGCFWCVEHDLHEAEGVLSVTSGYSGGTTPNPTYDNHGDYREAVEVEYNPSKTSFTKLAQFFLEHIDPTDEGGQFADRGASYRSAIFYATEEEKEIAENFLAELDASHIYEKPMTVEILKAGQFYKAEEYHQNYAEKNPDHYASYRKGSGREDFINRTCAIREEKHIAWSDTGSKNK
ncbi:MAG: peptide-methionine (S)-S-oxide reductase MsrA [Patescibacteria group bacterium]